MALWASAEPPGRLTAVERKAIVDATCAKQQADGGWSMASATRDLPNKQRDPASDPGKFMSDAATARAVFALTDDGANARRGAALTSPRRFC